MGLSNLDIDLASQYLPHIMGPIKYGENGAYFWVPGCGMTTILFDIVKNKNLWKPYLQGLTSRIRVFEFWGHLASKKTTMGLLGDYSSLKTKFEKVLDQGNEVVCFLGRIDDYPEEDKLQILKLFVRLNAINRRRIHILFQGFDKPWFEKAVASNSDLLTLANTIKIMPVPNQTFMEKYIEQKSKEFGYSVDTKDVTDTYGGMINLVKEYLRSNGRLNNLELKLKINWAVMPETYKKSILNGKVYPDLVEFGIWGLEAFKKHRHVLTDVGQSVLNVLTTRESQFYEYLLSHKGETLSKDLIISLLRSENTDEVSLWTIDQAISRFRKKLAQCGIDPAQLKTLKGKGYVWI